MLRLAPIFDKVMLRGGKDRQRIPYQASFVQSHFLADGTFDGISDEEQRIIFLIMETGIRPAEACNLSGATILLDHPVPHIRILPDGGAQDRAFRARDPSGGCGAEGDDCWHGRPRRRFT